MDDAIKASQSRIKEFEKEQKAKDKKDKKGKEAVRGAGVGGAFVADEKAAELVKLKEWNDIVSDEQRRDEAKAFAKEFGERLAERGVQQNVIDAEVNRFINNVNTHTNAYAEKMKDDWYDPLDIAGSWGKTVNNLIGGAASLFGDYGHGVKQAANERNESISDFLSDSVKLKNANFEYRQAKAAADGTGGFGATIKNSLSTGSAVSSTIESIGYLPAALFTGAGIGAAIRGIGAAMGFTGGAAAATGAAAGGSTSVGAKLSAALLSSEAIGAGAASGILAATDAAGGSYDSVMSLNFKNPKVLDETRARYIQNYGQSNWDSLVDRNNGDMEEVKKDLATQAARTAGGAAFATTAPLGVFGVERAIMGIAARGRAAHAGKRLITVGANSVSEILEEGLTQYSSNLGEHGITGVDLSSGVAEAAGMGAVAGAGLAGITQAASALGDRGRNRPQVSFDVNQLDPSSYVSAGNLDYNAYRATVGREMENVAKDARAGGQTDDQVQQLQQKVYDDYLDREVNWNTMTRDQRNEFKEFMRLSYNINTNNYTNYQNSAEIDAYNSGDINQVKAIIQNDAASADLLDAFRVQHGVELDQVNPQAIPYAKALAATIEAMNQQTANTTRERELQFRDYFQNNIVPNNDLTKYQRAAISSFMYNFANAGGVRMTDEQQKQWDDLQQLAAQARQNQQNQNPNQPPAPSPVPPPAPTPSPSGGQNNAAPTPAPNQQDLNLTPPPTQPDLDLQGGSNAQNQTIPPQPGGQQSNPQDAGGQPTQSAGQGSGTNQQGSQQAESVGQPPTGAPGGNNAQGVGTSTSRQNTLPGDSGNNTAQNSAGAGQNSAGAASTDQVGQPQNTPAPPANSGQATGAGSAGQASQGGQPAGQTRPGATPSPDGVGGARASQTERNPANRSQETTTDQASELSRELEAMSLEEYADWLVANPYVANDTGGWYEIYKRLTAYPGQRGRGKEAIQEALARLQGKTKEKQDFERYVLYQTRLAASKHGKTSPSTHEWAAANVGTGLGDKTGEDTYKSYITFNNPLEAAKHFVEFYDYLVKQGFNGQLKTPNILMLLVTHGDNIVMHGATPQDAIIAERAAREFFGTLQQEGRSEGINRTKFGVDPHNYTNINGETKSTSYTRYLEDVILRKIQAGDTTPIQPLWSPEPLPVRTPEEVQSDLGRSPDEVVLDAVDDQTLPTQQEQTNDTQTGTTTDGSQLPNERAGYENGNDPLGGNLPPDDTAGEGAIEDGQGDGPRPEGTGGAAAQRPVGGEAAQGNEAAPQVNRLRSRRRGNTATLNTEAGNFEVNYRVVEADSLTPALGISENQTRDRTGAASQRQIDNIASNLNPDILLSDVPTFEGSPTITRDGRIISGNGRSEAIRRAYENGNADAYRDALIDRLAEFGLSPSAVEGMRRPVLVREYAQDLTPAQVQQLVSLSNASPTLRMMAGELALDDARHLDRAPIEALSSVTISPDGQLTDPSGAAVAFVQQLPKSERDSLLTNGRLTKAGTTRFINALFAYAYQSGDADSSLVLREFINNDAEVAKNVFKGLRSAAPRMAGARWQVNQGIRPPMANPAGTVTGALRKITAALASANPAAHIQQLDALEDSNVHRVAEAFFDTRRSSKGVADIINRYLDVNTNEDVRSDDLFGAEPVSETARWDVALGVQDVRQEQAPPPSTQPAASEPTSPVQPAGGRRSFGLTLSASTGTIPGMARLQGIIDNPNSTQEEKDAAARTLNDVAFESLSTLVADVDGVSVERVDATGLYGGAVEPSLLVTLTIESDAAFEQARAVMVRFADNFNQEQVHLREDTTGELGQVHEDGSFNTVTYQIELDRLLTRSEIDTIISDSGLFGLTVFTNAHGNHTLEFYYYGDPTSTDAIEQFVQSAELAGRSASSITGSRVTNRRKISRAWFYSGPDTHQPGVTIPYADVTSELHTRQRKEPNAVTNAIARSLNRDARGFDQQDITPEQRALQNEIANAYDELPLYDLDNPLVRRAYEELAAEVLEQYKAMPLKRVELLTGQGEPYANSAEMRDDVRLNNRIKVYATTPDSFGSDPNTDYSQHPLMQDSGITDANGVPMVYNDLFRAVHDYYAHTMSPVEFGPKGEEAAWKNHLSMMRSPWAAWALTTETRGQNSWVNFRDGVENTPIAERPFADQKTALLPLDYAYTGAPQVDAKFDQLRQELSENEQRGSLALPESLLGFMPDEGQIRAAYDTLTRAEKSALWDTDAQTTIESIQEWLYDPPGAPPADIAGALSKLADAINANPDARKVRNNAPTRDEQVRKQLVQHSAGSAMTQEEQAAIEEFLDQQGSDLTAEELVNEVITSRLLDDGTSNDPTVKAAENNSVIKRIIDRIWEAIRDTTAAISLALATYFGTNLVMPVDAHAGQSVITEQQAVDHIVRTADNQGKNFVIADKQAGTLTLYDALGNELATTPALFGKEQGDTLTGKNTPAGRFDLTRETNISNPDYGPSAQVLRQDGELVQNPAGAVAIHRVYTGARSENRVERLESGTASDNRISHGCINVPESFFDQNLEGDLDAVVYVLPETDDWGGSLFTTPIENVQADYDNANSSGVEVTPEQIENAPSDAAVSYYPYRSLAPIRIAGTQATDQVALVTPVIIGGITADSIQMPFDMHTPAELVASGIFDTAPVDRNARTYSGENIYDLAVLLASLGGAGYVASRARKNLSSKKKKTDQGGQSSQQHSPSPRADAAQQSHAEFAALASQRRASGKKHTKTNITPPPAPDPVADAVNKAVWTEFLANSHFMAERNDKGKIKDDGNFVEGFADTMAGFEWAMDDVMSDFSYTQASDGTFYQTRLWRNRITDDNRAGVSARLMLWAAGATQTFDNWTRSQGMASFGYEADSSIPTKVLAQIRSKTSGAYSHIHKNIIKPLVLNTSILASELRRPMQEVEAAVGRLATVRHILDEAAAAHFTGLQMEIDAYENLHQSALEDARNHPDGSIEEYEAMKAVKAWAKKVKELTYERDQARAMYDGTKAWDGKTPMPGGYTRADAQAEVDRIEKEFGGDFERIEKHAQELTRAIRRIRDYAAANGVFDNSNLRLFKELGFKNYVPLYSEQSDPRIVDESTNYTQLSHIDRILEELPTQQAKSMGLVKNLSLYHREGATSPAADAYTNFKVFAMNMAGRVGQQPWLEVVQQMHEGTVGKPISASRVTNADELSSINATPEGKAVGLIRVKPGTENNLMRAVRAKITDTQGNLIRPIRAKGYDEYGQLVDFNYYFTERAIQNEVYENANLVETLSNRALKNVGSITRVAARMMTTFKPVWNVYNFLRDAPERLSIMLMRPVKDINGEFVSKAAIVRRFGSNLGQMTISPEMAQDIYRYIAQGETHSTLQKTLDDAVQGGAINLLTTQTDKHSIMSELSQAQVDVLTKKLKTMLGNTANRSGAGGIVRGANSAVEFYVQAFTEVPQVMVALAAYKTYLDLNVNKQEAANRVRDQYDPLRASAKLVGVIGTLYPFVRSTLSGHYNVARTLSEYWQPNDWRWTATYLAGGVAGALVILGMASAMFGDDEDGIPRLARLPVTQLMNGIPVPVGENGMWSAPVGFGMPKIIWGTAANLWRQYNGQQTGGDTLQAMVGVVMDNTSPITVASGNVFAENPTAAIALTMTPLLATPFAEMAVNTRAFGGSRIYGRETPADQLNSQQDDFNTPEVYKEWAKAIHAAGFGDYRPESLRHLVESYSFGPMKAIPMSVFSDKQTKTLGIQSRKGEEAGVFHRNGRGHGVEPQCPQGRNLLMAHDRPAKRHPPTHRCGQNAQRG